jgi:hypothetical protein
MRLAALIDRLRGAAPRWRTLPTADYYLLGGVGDLVRDDANPTQARPIVRLGPNTWAHENHLVVVRYATAGELALLEGRRWRSVHYVIDDLITAAEASAELPGDYRGRLAQFARDVLPRILAPDPVIVAPSAAILGAFPGRPGRLLDPCCLALAGGNALPAPTPWNGPLRIAFLGTRSHFGALPLLGAIAARLELALPEARLHLFFGRHLPHALARCRNIVNRPPVAWADYPDFCRANPFHIGLALVQDTPFARARSITKVMDHAAVGAVGIYARRAPFADVVTDGSDGLLVDDAAEAWCAAILGLAARPAHARHVAAAGARLAADRGAPARLRAFWCEALEISCVATQ